MTLLEVTLVLLGKLSNLGLALSAISGCVCVAMAFFYLAHTSDATCSTEWRREEAINIRNTIKSSARPWAYLFVVSSILACMPSVDDLWRLRISLIKLELASPANVQKSVDEITRIADKLECKYLGCKAEKKGKGD